MTLSGDGLCIGGQGVPNSKVHINGSLSINPEIITEDTHLSGNSCVFADTSSNDIRVTLPFAGNMSGRRYSLKKTSPSNQMIISATEGIDGAKVFKVLPSENLKYPTFSIISDGQQWYVEIP